MRSDLILLCFAYVLSQFFRAFLAVLTNVLGTDIGASAEDLATASSIWFLVFAAMQLPIGWALDTLGPRRTVSTLLFGGGGIGALVFAFASTSTHINIAMGLIGIGCAPVLMASFYIFARSYPAAKFATLAALMLGVGSVGNLIASYPMALAAELFGWRLALVGLAALSAITAAGLFVMVQDPPKVEHDEKGSVLDILKIPALWLIFPLMFVNYAPAAAIRGLWIGPYLSDVFAVDTVGIGQASLVMGIAMILGTLAYGPLDRIFGTRKWVVLPGVALSSSALFALALNTSSNAGLSIALLAALGFFSAVFPVIIAHARQFFPEHLAGRGVTLLNLFGIGGVGLMQFTTGRIHSATQTGSADQPYTILFTFFAVLLLVGFTVYLFSTEKRD